MCLTTQQRHVWTRQLKKCIMKDNESNTKRSEYYTDYLWADSYIIIFFYMIVKPDGSRILQLWSDDRSGFPSPPQVMDMMTQFAQQGCSGRVFGRVVMLGVCASRTIIINIFWQTWCLQESVQQCLIGKVASSVLRWFGGRRWKKYKWLKPGTWCKSMNVCKSHWISLWQSAISWTKNLCMPSLLKAMPMAHATALHRPYWVPRSAGAAMKDEAAWALMSVPNGS